MDWKFQMDNQNEIADERCVECRCCVKTIYEPYLNANANANTNVNDYE